MDAYPDDYVAHNLPFIAFSGLDTPNTPLNPSAPGSQVELGTDEGIVVASQLPPVTGERAEQLLQELFSADGSNGYWNGRTEKSKPASLSFKLRAVGRDLKLPPRKANPPLDTSPTLSPEGKPTLEKRPSWVLHSPISPLSPISPIYPDGLMTPLWLEKHQYRVPAVFICFFGFTSDPNRNSLNDNQLKSEINRMKGLITQSGYKTRFVAILLSNKTILEAPDIEERLSNIRRATGLDPKNSLFFLPPNTSRVELASFVTSLLTTLQPICVEYYRELTKHARRKKGRGHIPPPTAPPTKGTSQTLSGPGWQVRYEFKLGVFAEFRQEMDAAGRHYALAFDALLAPDGPFETTPTWSPRWDEYRLLADIIALRLLRCQMWNNITTTSVQAWTTYRERIRDVLNRRGKGSKNYGWAAWESRWARIMADVIEKADLQVFAIPRPMKNADVTEEPSNSIFALPEKAIPVGERLRPWQHLHHPGYWRRLSASYARTRQIMAEDIPEEDRLPPGQSPATSVANRYGTYDTYLCPEPHIESPLPQYGEKGFDHTTDILVPLKQAANDFSVRNQQRWVDKLHLDAGEQLIRAGRFNEALEILKPLWERMHWREEGWWLCVRRVCEATSQCAIRAGARDVFVATRWELLSNLLYHKSGMKQDFMNCLDVFDEQSSESVKQTIVVHSERTTPFLAVMCTFETSEAHVGEPLQTQLSIYSQAHENSTPLKFTTVKFQFEGCLGEIKLSHKDSEESATPKSTLAVVQLKETDESTPSRLCLHTEADLTIYPNQRKVFAFPVFFREAGEVAILGSDFLLSTPKFDLKYSSSVESQSTTASWWLQDQSGFLRAKNMNIDKALSLKVLPKPPKLEIQVLDDRKQYYTDEKVTVEIEITNGEEEETAIVLEARFFSRTGDVLDYQWITSAEEANDKRRQSADSTIDLPGHPIGNLQPGEKLTEIITFTGTPLASEHVLEIKALYHLVSDFDTPLSKTVAEDVIFSSPFEANYELSPRVHPEPWPSVFILPDRNTEDEDKLEGITQRWNLAATIVSFAEEPLVIESTVLVTQTATGGVVSHIRGDEGATKEVEMKIKQSAERNFDIDIQKSSLDDRRPCSLEMSLAITWRRATSTNTEASESQESVTSHLPIPRLTIPILEPRVILTSEPSTANDPFTTLTYALENPTLHFLTFDIGMEATDTFAFSGPKLRAVNLLPLTRQQIEYRIVPLVGAIGKEGGWMYPQFRAVDRYFGKTLKVLGGEGTKDTGKEKDNQGLSVWVEAC